MSGTRPEAGAAALAAGKARTRGDALRVVLIYAVFAGLWILLSDEALVWIYSDPEQLMRASIIKGWLFVVVTALLLYGLIHRLLDQTLAASRRELAAQAERARALQLLAAIVDNSSDAIFAKDIEGRYLIFNRETARVVGKTAGQALGCDDTELFPPAQAAMIRDNDRRVLAEDRIRSCEEVLDTVDGRRTFIATKGPLRDGEGRVVGIFGISRDVTEQLRADADLRATVDELERFNRLAVGRELDMIRLKQQVNTLSTRLGLAPPYGLAFAEPSGTRIPD
jgi:PAS domain S-box-containing protein